MGNHAKAWQNKDVYFRVSEESEQMLVKDWVSPTCGIKEGCV